MVHGVEILYKIIKLININIHHACSYLIIYIHEVFSLLDTYSYDIKISLDDFIYMVTSLIYKYSF